MWNELEPEDLPDLRAQRHLGELHFALRTRAKSAKAVYPAVLQWLCEGGRACPRLRQAVVPSGFVVWAEHDADAELEQPQLKLCSLSED